MIKKLFLSLLGFFMISTSAMAQKPLADTLLWKIEGEDLEKPSYLYGTIHAICSVVINDKMTRALNEVDALVMEVDINDLSYLTSKESLNSVVIGQGQTWADHLDDNDFKTVSEFLGKFQSVNLATVELLKPNMVSTALIKDLASCSLEAYEIELNKYAKANSLSVLGLETFREQMKVLLGQPLQEQFENFVTFASLDKEEHEQMMTDMMQLYTDENLQGLYDLITEENAVNEIMDTNVMLDERNQKWIPKLKKIMAEQPAFIAVGAGHLAGEQGVIQLLSEAGYTVSPVLE